MNNDSLTVTIKANGTQFKQAMNEAQQQLKQFNGTVQESEGAATRSGSAFGRMADMVKGVGVAFIAYGVIQSVQNMGAAVLSTSGDLEQVNIAFQGMIGNAKEANSIFGQLVQYANVTPFQSADIEAAARTLMGFGTSGQQTVDLIKQLGDVTAASGGNLQQLSLVTGQIFAQGKLRAQDMYQVINDGGAALIKIMAQDAGGMKKLTAEFDAGGIPADKYFKAIQKAVAQGGFAFQGAQKQAQTLNGELSTLEDTALQFGEALIGVHVDPELGLMIQPGGLFDRMKKSITSVTNAMSSWGPAVSKAMPQILSTIGEFKNKVVDLAAQIANFLAPSILALWGTLDKQVIPVMARLWHEVIVPLLPVIGQLLVGAIWLAINALNIFLQTITPVINFMLDHKTIVIDLALAFGVLAGYMAFNAIFNALTIGFNTLRLITIPNVMASLSALKTAIASGTVFGPIVITGALIALQQVYDAAQKTKQAIDAAANAAVKATDQTEAIKYYEQQYAAGKITKTQETNAINAILKGVDAVSRQVNKSGLSGRASGGPVFAGVPVMVGETGPEVYVPTQSGQIFNRSQMRQAGGGEVTIHFNGTVYMRDEAEVQNVADILANQLRAARAGAY